MKLLNCKILLVFVVVFVFFVLFVNVKIFDVDLVVNFVEVLIELYQVIVIFNGNGVLIVE